jgi:hypothetical protein
MYIKPYLSSRWTVPLMLTNTVVCCCVIINKAMDILSLSEGDNLSGSVFREPPPPVFCAAWVGGRGF